MCPHALQRWPVYTGLSSRPGRGPCPPADVPADPSPPPDSPVEPGFRRDIPAGLFHGALGRADHVPDPQVLDADHVEPARDARGGLLRPVLAAVGLAGLQPRDRDLDPAAPTRAAPGPGELPRRRRRRRPRGRAGRGGSISPVERAADRDAPVDPDNLAGTRTRDWIGDDRERDMPVATPVTGHPERLRPAEPAGPAEAHPARLSGPRPRRTSGSGAGRRRLHRDDPEPLVRPALRHLGRRCVPAKNPPWPVRGPGWPLLITEPSASHGLSARASVSCRHRSAKPGILPRPRRSAPPARRTDSTRTGRPSSAAAGSPPARVSDRDGTGTCEHSSGK